MKFAQKQRFNKPRDLSNCYRIIRNRVYIQDSDGIYFYDFQDFSELEKMKIARTKTNMKSGVVDDWECCDSNGLWSGFKKAKLIKMRLSKEKNVLFEKYKKIKYYEFDSLTAAEREFLDNSDWIVKLLDWIENEEYWTKVLREKQ